MDSPLLVLSGGLGTRIRSVIGEQPKALADTNGTPFLVRQIQNWEKCQFSEIILLLHYKADQVIEIVESYQFKIKIRFVVEPTLLGTGGAIRHAIVSLKLTRDFFVTNADTWLPTASVVLPVMSVPSIAIVWQEQFTRFGLLDLDTDKKIVVGFTEKPKIKTSGWINSGLYKFSVDNFFNKKDIKFSLEETILPELCKQRSLKFFKLSSVFIDIGVPADYERLKNYLKENDENY